VNKKQRNKREKQSCHHTQDTAHYAFLREQEGANIESGKQSWHPKDESGKNKKPSWVSRIVKCLRRNSSVVIALFTIVIAFVGAIQAIIYSSQVNIIRQQLIASVRPYVSFPALGSNVPGIYQGKVTSQRVQVRWENGGGSPTVDGRASYGHTLTFGMAEVTDFTKPDFSDVPFVAGPKSTGNLLVDVPLNALDGVEKKKNRAFLWGWLVYRDTFKDTPKHLTEFCIEIRDVIATAEISSDLTKPPDLSDPKTRFTLDPATCPQHNCYDENCSDYTEKTK
jgi:hypothetical protein